MVSQGGPLGPMGPWAPSGPWGHIGPWGPIGPLGPMGPLGPGPWAPHSSWARAISRARSSSKYGYRLTKVYRYKIWGWYIEIENDRRAERERERDREIDRYVDRVVINTWSRETSDKRVTPAWPAVLPWGPCPRTFFPFGGLSIFFCFYRFENLELSLKHVPFCGFPCTCTLSHLLREFSKG